MNKVIIKNLCILPRGIIFIHTAGAGTVWTGVIFSASSHPWRWEVHVHHVHHFHLQRQCRISHWNRTVKIKLSGAVFAVVVEAEMKLYFLCSVVLYFEALLTESPVKNASTLVPPALLKCLVCINKMMSQCCQTVEIALVFNIDFKTAAHDLLQVIIWTVKHNVILWLVVWPLEILHDIIPSLPPPL